MVYVDSTSQIEVHWFASICVYALYALMLTSVWSTLVSMHTYECDYACMNVWVHAAGDWSVGSRVWMMGDGDGMQSGGGLVGDGVNRYRVEEDHNASSVRVITVM